MWSTIVSLGLASTLDGLAVPSDVETVRARIVAEAGAKPPDPQKIRSYVLAQKVDGSWDGIFYGATNRTLWPPMEHLIRLTELARGYHSDALPESERAAAAQAFVKGFDFWVARDPKSSNWWYNEIGAVQSLYRLMLLTEPLLTEGRIEKGCALLARARLGMTGQNLVDLAETVIGRAALQRDATLMSNAFDRIEAEIVVTQREGIQPDFSFHQHGAQLYSGGYGAGFAASAPKFALLAQGTSFAFAPEKIRILENYLLEGQQWMIRGSIFDYSASGRGLTRPGSGSVGGYASTARSLLKLEACTRREELQRLAARIEDGGAGKAPPLTGHKHFWCSDYTVHHRPEWMASVRLTSDRLLQTEIVNEENQLGEHLSDGVMYLYRTGAEYRNLFPAWDWARLPGITVEVDRPLQRIDNRRKGTLTFAGGCSDGVRGVSAMDFERNGLTARKAWFFFDGEVVCLGAGITATNGYRVITSVNQCLADGPVTLKRAGQAAEALTVPRQIERPAWVQHGGVGYLFLEGGENVAAGTSVQTGSWKRISSAQKADAVSSQVFSLWIDHGRNPRGAAYGYVVSAAKEVAAMDAYTAALPVRVLANTRQLQAVEQVRSGILQVAFYEAGSVTSETWGGVGADTPCLLLLTRTSGKTRVTACNPCNRESPVHVSVGKQRVTIPFPSGQQAGGSRTVEF